MFIFFRLYWCIHNTHCVAVIHTGVIYVWMQFVIMHFMRYALFDLIPKWNKKCFRIAVTCLFLSVPVCSCLCWMLTLSFQKKIFSCRFTHELEYIVFNIWHRWLRMKNLYQFSHKIYFYPFSAVDIICSLLMHYYFCMSLKIGVGVGW